MNEKLEKMVEAAVEEETKDNAPLTTDTKEHDVALRIAVKLIKMFEGCELVAYPDPGSDLYKALVKNNLLRKWKSGEVTLDKLDKDLKKLSYAPATIGYGETSGVKLGDVWTQEQAAERLEKRVREFLVGVLKACPQLKQESQERIAACVSLAYNIGNRAFAQSQVCAKTQEKCYGSAADGFVNWTKAGGVMLPGLVKRRQTERDLYIAGG